ncbi:MAG: histidine kinase [Chloroflexota bacterium]
MTTTDPLPTALASATERDRASLVLRIHDDVLQMLGLVGIRSDLAADAADVGRVDKARAELASVRDALQGAVERLREIIVDWRPFLPEKESLAAALDDYLSQLSACTGATVSLRGTPPDGLDALQSILVYRCAQALLGPEKSAGRLESVRLTFAASGLSVSVRPHFASPAGLPAAAFYAEALHARLHVDGQPPHKVSLRLPRTVEV